MTAEVLAFRPRMSRTERTVISIEERRAWKAARELGGRIDLATRAERPDLALACAGQIVAIADRRIRQLDGGNDGNAA